MGDFDATIAAAGYRDTEIIHPRTCTSEKEGWIPVKLEPKGIEREHMRAKQAEGGLGLRSAGAETKGRST